VFSPGGLKGEGERLGWQKKKACERDKQKEGVIERGSTKIEIYGLAS